MSSSLRDKLDEMNLTSDELKRLSDAFKKEEFRKLFADYAEEISNPENRALYEEEIRQLEKERGMNVTFVHPKPGYVLKTTADGLTKTFINICISDHVGSPTSEKKLDFDGKKGLSWSIPHLFSQQREDFAKDKKKCIVFDFIVHPHTYRMAETNPRFKCMVNNLAIEGLRKMFKMELDKRNFKQIKMNYKGAVTCSVMRSRITDSKLSQPEDDILSKFPYPYGEESSSEKAERLAKEISTKSSSNSSKNKDSFPKISDDCFTVPKYEMKHQSDVDFQNYFTCPNLSPNTRPQRLVIEIFLPLLKSASSINLDVFEKLIKLESHKPARYHLEITLPYPVDENASSAKFDKTEHKLTIVLTVLNNECSMSDVYNGSLDNDASICTTNPDGLLDLNGEQDGILCDLWKEQTNTDEDDEFESKELCEENEITKPYKEIIVVHERENPKLHGILKQRSSSNSSDEHFGTSSDQLTSEEEGDAEYDEDNACFSLPSSFGSKKSVSFNDHVDQTVYQINQSVCTLHATLKNKRKKLKKKVQKREFKKLKHERRRRNSNSFSCESALEEVHEDEQQEATKECSYGISNVTSICNSADSGIEECSYQSMHVVQDSESAKWNDRFHHENEMTDFIHEKSDTILAWKEGDVKKNVTCPVDFENPQIFSLDL